MYEEQLCWSCKKAYGGCNWSDFFKPVDGWYAKPTTVIDNRYVSESYDIKQCPEYEYDGICIKCDHYDKQCTEPRYYYKLCNYCHSRRKVGDCANFKNGAIRGRSDD